MKPYCGDYLKHSECLRSTTKTAKLRARNADRSKKKSTRYKVKQLLKDFL